MFAHESTGLITLSVIILACVSALGLHGAHALWNTYIRTRH